MVCLVFNGGGMTYLLSVHKLNDYTTSGVFVAAFS
jgi:hypothetical protein